MRLKNESILVTGAASGIGAAAVKISVSEGAEIVATGCQIDRLPP